MYIATNKIEYHDIEHFLELSKNIQNIKIGQTIKMIDYLGICKVIGYGKTYRDFCVFERESINITDKVKKEFGETCYPNYHLVPYINLNISSFVKEEYRHDEYIEFVLNREFTIQYINQGKIIEASVPYYSLTGVEVSDEIHKYVIG